MEKITEDISMSKFRNEIGITEKLRMISDEIPKDYHCTCKYCSSDNFIGEIYDWSINKYYSQLARNKYYFPLSKDIKKHLCPGQWQGYRWAVQNFTDSGDWTFDPTVGTGTSMIESLIHRRNAVGIELEYSSITRMNLNHIYNTIGKSVSYKTNPLGVSHLINGNARDLKKLLIDLEKRIFGTFNFRLIMNGPPYPILSGKNVSSDAPERKIFKDKNGKKVTKISNAKLEKDQSFDYQNPDNFGSKRGEEYWNFITKMYLDCIPFMVKKGKMVIIIKDLVNKKKPYLLHKKVIDNILNQTDLLKYYGWYIHKHIPRTMFMNTYPKRFPEVKIPLYQTAIVLEKI